MDKDKNAGLAAPRGYVPPKAWEEINDSEKIERMREIVKGLQAYCGRCQVDIHKLGNNFEKHSHTDQGDIVVPYNKYSDNGNGTAETAKSSAVNYF